MSNDSLTLKEVRERMNLTQAELAERLGVSSSTIGAWETGVSEIPIAKFRSLCQMADVSMDLIFCPVSPKK